MTDVEATLKQRGEQYGSYVEQARVTQNIKLAMKESANWRLLAPDQRETCEMIAVKLGRILTGNQNHFDSWHDIAGYATLVAGRVCVDEAVGR